MSNKYIQSVNAYVKSINEKFGTTINGISPIYGTGHIPKTVDRIVVRDYGNGVGETLYIDRQNRFVAHILGEQI